MAEIRVTITKTVPEGFWTLDWSKMSDAEIVDLFYEDITEFLNDAV